MDVSLTEDELHAVIAGTTLLAVFYRDSNDKPEINTALTKLERVRDHG